MKLDIKISEASVTKYMVRRPKLPSQTWPTFLKNHVNTAHATAEWTAQQMLEAFRFDTAPDIY
jgi:hypothetical protein